MHYDGVRVGAEPGNINLGCIARRVVDFVFIAGVVFCWTGTADAVETGPKVDIIDTTYVKNGETFTATVESRHRNLPGIQGSRYTTAVKTITPRVAAASVMRGVARGAGNPVVTGVIIAGGLIYDSGIWRTEDGEAEPVQHPAEVAGQQVFQPNCSTMSPGDFWYSAADQRQWLRFEQGATPSGWTAIDFCSDGGAVRTRAVSDPLQTVWIQGSVQTQEQAETRLAPVVTSQSLRTLSTAQTGMAPHDYGPQYSEETKRREIADPIIQEVSLQHQELLHSLDPDQYPAPAEQAESVVDPISPEDAQMQRDNERWAEPPPPFADVLIPWQMETFSNIDPYDTGLAATAACPSDLVVSVPGFGEFKIVYAPMCTLADWLRPAVLAASLLFSLFLVVRD